MYVKAVFFNNKFVAVENLEISTNLEEFLFFRAYIINLLIKISL